MPSIAYRRWRTTGAAALDEVEAAHAAVGGTGPGRRYATQQVNHAYAVLLVAQFQKFCRDLHNECVDALLARVPQSVLRIASDEFLRTRFVDRGNPNPGNLGADFARLGVPLWPELTALHPAAPKWQRELELLVAWRNAIAHQDFDPGKLGSIISLGLRHVQQWRRTCHRLARGFDSVMHGHLTRVNGVPPW